MSALELYEQVKSLPLAERIELAHRLWENIAEEEGDFRLTPEQVAELDRRADRALAHPEESRSVEDVFSAIEASFRANQ